MIQNPINRRQFIGQILVATAGAAIIAAPKNPRWQIGCYTRPWAGFDYQTAFDGIAAAGFKYAGLMTCKTGNVVTKDTTPEQALAVANDAKKRGLEIASVYGGNFEVRRSIDEGITGLKNLIDICVICGSPSLLLGGQGDPSLVDNYYKIIKECCDYAAEKKVIITIKPHGPLNSTGRECRPLVEKVGHPNFRMWYDPGNIYYYSDGKISPVDDAAEVDGTVKGMSIKDFRMPKDVDVTPGTGMVDFPGVMASLKKGGFKKGPLIVECLSRGDLSGINAEAKKACRFMQELIQ
jgi:sugar phosphate isomerase/epimerase